MIPRDMNLWRYAIYIFNSNHAFLRTCHAASESRLVHLNERYLYQVCLNWFADAEDL